MKEHGLQHVDPDGVFRCKECGKEFPDYMPLRKHMRAFHGPTKYPCPHCDKIFPRSVLPGAQIVTQVNARSQGSVLVDSLQISTRTPGQCSQGPTK